MQCVIGPLFFHRVMYRETYAQPRNLCTESAAPEEATWQGKVPRQESNGVFSLTLGALPFLKLSSLYCQYFEVYLWPMHDCSIVIPPIGQVPATIYISQIRYWGVISAEMSSFFSLTVAIRQPITFQPMFMQSNSFNILPQNR